MKPGDHPLIHVDKPLTAVGAVAWAGVARVGRACKIAGVAGLTLVLVACGSSESPAPSSPGPTPGDSSSSGPATPTAKGASKQPFADVVPDNRAQIPLVSDTVSEIGTQIMGFGTGTSDADRVVTIIDHRAPSFGQPAGKNSVMAITDPDIVIDGVDRYRVQPGSAPIGLTSTKPADPDDLVTCYAGEDSITGLQVGVVQGATERQIRFAVDCNAGVATVYPPDGLF